MGVKIIKYKAMSYEIHNLKIIINNLKNKIKMIKTTMK